LKVTQTDSNVYILYHKSMEDFYICEIEDGSFYVTPAYNPDLPPLTKELVEAAFIRINDGLPDINPVSYYGAYFSTVKECIDATIDWASRDHSDWPKSYIKPLGI
jgi:hypothetical protein